MEVILIFHDRCKTADGLWQHGSGCGHDAPFDMSPNGPKAKNGKNKVKSVCGVRFRGRQLGQMIV
jgi:hypothetical protein